MEKELRDYCTVHATRIPLKTVDEQSLQKMNKELVKAVALILDCNPDVIVYGCTSGSFVDVVSMATARTIPAVTASQAVVAALKTLTAKTVSVATPYIDAVNQREKAFLESNGFYVVDMKGLDLLQNTDIGNQSPDTVYTLATSLKKADVTFISCTNFETFPIIKRIEKDTGAPVVSSNSAVLWRVLQLGKTYTPVQLGVLLEEFL
jgi:maleate isomerase